MRNQKQQKGFTLIELLVVLSVIGLMASIFLVTFHNARVVSRDNKRVADMHQLYNALYLYNEIYGSLPSCSSGGYAGGCDVTSVGSIIGSMDTSFDGLFVEFLKSSKLISTTPKDPKNTETNFYAYNANTTFPAGSSKRYIFLIGTILENPNHASLKYGIPAQTPGYESAYILGLPR